MSWEESSVARVKIAGIDGEDLKVFNVKQLRKAQEHTADQLQEFYLPDSTSSKDDINQWVVCKKPEWLDYSKISKIKN